MKDIITLITERTGAKLCNRHENGINEAMTAKYRKEFMETVKPLYKIADMQNVRMITLLYALFDNDKELLNSLIDFVISNKKVQNKFKKAAKDELEHSSSSSSSDDWCNYSCGSSRSHSYSCGSSRSSSGYGCGGSDSYYC